MDFSNCTLHFNLQIVAEPYESRKLLAQQPFNRMFLGEDDEAETTMLFPNGILLPTAVGVTHLKPCILDIRKLAEHIIQVSPVDSLGNSSNEHLPDLRAGCLLEDTRKQFWIFRMCSNF